MDLFASQDARPDNAPLTVFHAAVLRQEQTDWQSLFAGFTRLKAITFSSSVEFLLRLAADLEDVEVVFGSERILSREQMAFEQATQIVESYRVTDAIADHKALSEGLARLLGRAGRTLLPRVLSGDLRFRLLRKRPSHEKLYLLSGPGRYRVVTGSANLSAAAFEGRQQEIYIALDGEDAYRLFEAYYQRDHGEAAPVDADLLAVPGGADTPPRPRTDPIDLLDTPIARLVKAGVTVVEEPGRGVLPGFTADSLRAAAALGAEIKDLALQKTRSGQTVVTSQSLVKAVRFHQARPVAGDKEERLPRAEISFDRGEVRVDGRRWLAPDLPVDPETAAGDARLLADYIGSFDSFSGDTAGGIATYWSFLVWLYAAPVAPYLRQAALPAHIDPWVYPVFAVLYGRSSAGKTTFAKVALRSMFGFEKSITGKTFTAIRALGLRAQLGAIPLLIDDVSRDRFNQHAPDLIKVDVETETAYAPIVLTTNRDLTAISPDLSKRMVACHLDLAVAESTSAFGKSASRTLGEIGTGLYRAYCRRLLAEVPDMRARIDAGEKPFPDLFEVSSRLLRGLLRETLGELPGWAVPLSYTDYFGLRHRKVREQIREILNDERVRYTVNARANRLELDFGEDAMQARQFLKNIPEFLIPRQLGGTITLDLDEVENFLEVKVRRGWRRWLRR